MTLADFLDDVATERKTLIIYASEEAPDVGAHFDTRNVTVEYESLAPGGPAGFAVLRAGDDFVGAFDLGHLAELLSPPIVRPWQCEELSRPWRDLYQILDNSLFASFDRRQLLGATREIENRAWRIGTGSLRAGFQSVDAFQQQAAIYRRLADETDLAVHVYVADAWELPSNDQIAVHAELGEEIARYWTVVFDAAGDPTNAGALLAEERDPDEFFGFWTYDPERVDAMATYLRETYE